jgi:hypothetical protein
VKKSAKSVFHITGGFLTLNVLETFNSLRCAKDRLDDLAALGNKISESDPYYRKYRRDRFVVTDAPVPELMDQYSGATLVTIQEQQT